MILRLGPSSLRPPHIHLTLFTWWMSPGLARFSPFFHSRVLYWTQTKEQKTGKAWGQGYLAPLLGVKLFHTLMTHLDIKNFAAIATSLNSDNVIATPLPMIHNRSTKVRRKTVPYWLTTVRVWDLVASNVRVGSWDVGTPGSIAIMDSSLLWWVGQACSCGSE